MIDAFAINGKRHRRNLKDIYIIGKLSHDLTTLRMFPSVKKPRFFYQNIPESQKLIRSVKNIINYQNVTHVRFIRG